MKSSAGGKIMFQPQKGHSKSVKELGLVCCANMLHAWSLLIRLRLQLGAGIRDAFKRIYFLPYVFSSSISSFEGTSGLIKSNPGLCSERRMSPVIDFYVQPLLGEEVWALSTRSIIKDIPSRINNSKICMESQKTPNNKSNLERTKLELLCSLISSYTTKL